MQNAVHSQKMAKIQLTAVFVCRYFIIGFSREKTTMLEQLRNRKRKWFGNTFTRNADSIASKHCILVSPT